MLPQQKPNSNCASFMGYFICLKLYVLSPGGGGSGGFSPQHHCYSSRCKMLQIFLLPVFSFCDQGRHKNFYDPIWRSYFPIYFCMFLYTFQLPYITRSTHAKGEFSRFQTLKYSKEIWKLKGSALFGGQPNDTRSS